MNIKLVTLALVAAVGICGCQTTSKYVHPDEDAKVTGGFSQKDFAYTVKVAVDSLRTASGRYRGANGARRVLNVKNITVDTTDRGNAAAGLAEELGQYLREALTEDGCFVIYNEKLAAQALAQGASVPSPEFVLYGRLGERNVRKDNGDFYREYSLNLQLVGTAASGRFAGLEVWQKRIPLRKEIDEDRILN